MAQFLGEHDVPVDEKGRIFVPAEFRKKLPPEANETFIVVRGFDRCLTAYPQHVWEDTARKMLRLPQTERNVRMLIRGMLSQAAEVKLDRQGRANIPRKLLERAGISDHMVVIGALDKLEFWDPEDWSEVMAEADTSMQKVAENYEL
jgi:MraZ protein